MIVFPPKMINIPEFHDEKSIKSGFLFCGFEKNMNILLLNFSETI